MNNLKECPFYNICNHIDCDKDICIKERKLNELFDLALVSDTQRIKINLFPDKDGTDKEEFKKLTDIQHNIVDFVNNGNNLYIASSNCGVGKTEWSLRLIQAYLNSIWARSSLTCRVLFINVPRYLIAIKDNISEKSDYVKHIKDNVLQADLVVWDELGTKGLTTFEHEAILNVLNARLDLGKSNIFTSNLTGTSLKEAVGDRIYSRTYNSSEVIILHGKDKRKLKRGSLVCK